eukprot:scaffold20254_cov73-Skeletonema_marinoi.AAC.2
MKEKQEGGWMLLVVVVTLLFFTDTICRKKRSLKHSLPAPMKGGRGANRTHFLLTEFALKVERSSHIISDVFPTVNTITVNRGLDLAVSLRPIVAM